MNVPVEVVNNKVMLPNFFQYPYRHRFRDYRVNYELVVPQSTKVISLRKDDINIEGDLDADGINDDDEDSNDGNNTIKVEKNKITINGNTIVTDDNDRDSVIINNKKYQKEVTEKMLDSMKIGLKDMKKLKDLNISITEGKDETTIKTGK